MPAFETMDLTDIAVLWIKHGIDLYNEPTVYAPVEIPCRWTYNDSVMINDKGEQVQLSAEVVVAQDIPYDSVIWLGMLNSWYGVGSAGQDTQVMQVKVKKFARDIKGMNTRRTIGLMRYKNKPPTVA